MLTCSHSQDRQPRDSTHCRTVPRLRAARSPAPPDPASVRHLISVSASSTMHLVPLCKKHLPVLDNDWHRAAQLVSLHVHRPDQLGRISPTGEFDPGMPITENMKWAGSRSSPKMTRRNPCARNIITMSKITYPVGFSSSHARHPGSEEYVDTQTGRSSPVRSPLAQCRKAILAVWHPTETNPNCPQEKAGDRNLMNAYFGESAGESASSRSVSPRTGG